jgi:hypothetical protein
MLKRYLNKGEIMPLSEGFKLQQGATIEVLPEGIYQVVIDDISDVKGTAYKSDKEVTQLEWTFRVLEGEQKDKVIKKWTSTAYAPAKAGRKESNLFSIVTKACHTQLNPEELHLSSLIGKQIKIVVSEYTNEAGYERNRIDSFMEAKEEIKEVITASNEKKNDEDKEEINLDDIPF